MEQDIRWKQRFQNFEKAFLALKEVTEIAAPTEIEIDAAVQRYEIAFELAWKPLQDYLEEQGYTDFKGPKRVLVKAFQDGLLDNGELWMTMHEARNVLSHTYDYDKSRLIFKDIAGRYAGAFESLYKRLNHER